MPMKKFINAPENLTVELLEGFALAYSRKIALQGKTVLRAAPKSRDKVALVTLGGAGHEPALSGFVGPGMLDASVVGDIFAAPGAPAVLAALQTTARDAGTLLVILNHAGDVMAGDMAFEMAVQQGLKVQKILTHEDISAGKDAPLESRRGLVGCIPLYKIAGAAAEAGRTRPWKAAAAWSVAFRCTRSPARRPRPAEAWRTWLPSRNASTRTCGRWPWP
ncbi:MAG: dihydroxyacetone kinase subunit DhaK [Pirellulaceae bacterium]|nr:dihydroxyacetone kinase subunit DhaK [Pirellulaceae bacterium]